MPLAAVPSLCAWCNGARAIVHDEQGDPVCPRCRELPGPAQESAREAAARLGVSTFLLLRAAREQRERSIGSRLYAHVWMRLAREIK